MQRDSQQRLISGVFFATVEGVRERQQLFFAASKLNRIEMLEREIRKEAEIRETHSPSCVTGTRVAANGTNFSIRYETVLVMACKGESVGRENIVKMQGAEKIR